MHREAVYYWNVQGVQLSGIFEMTDGMNSEKNLKFPKQTFMAVLPCVVLTSIMKAFHN